MSTVEQLWGVLRRVNEAVHHQASKGWWKRTLGVLLAFLTILSLENIGTPGQAQDLDRFRVRFITRQFTPAPGLEIEAIRTQRVGHTEVPPKRQSNSADQLARPDMGHLIYLPFVVGGAADESVHFLMQFENLPGFSDRQRFADQGIHLIAYVTGNTYVVSASVSKLNDVQNIPGVRWAGPLQVDDKVSPALSAGNIGAWARTPDGREVLTIQFHQDVDIAQVEALVAALGGDVYVAVPTIPAITAVFEPGQAERIAQQDIVQYVDAVELPLEPHNDGARVAANVTPLAQAPYNLTGAGVTVLVYDSGIVDATHPDFGARVIQTDPDATETVRDHSTHVAGTVGGSGVNSNGNRSDGVPNGGTAGQWAGMAPAVNIRSFGSSGSTDVLYDSSGDLNGDFTNAINNGTDLATMSQGNNVVLNGFPCGQLGDYANTAILIDNIVRGSIAGQQLIYFESVGNERQDPDGPGGVPPAPCGQFSTISSPATAKNSIAVGAINSNNNTMTGFSSFGPTDDGRLKPDITAPGCQTNGDMSITSPSFIDADLDGNLDTGEVQNAYVQKCGTSMSTPVAAGATALLVEQWQSTRGAGARPLPHTVKAILVHTATDRGNPGPDYQFGWGSLDAQAAVDLVIDDDTDDLIHVDQVDNGDTDFYTFNSDGATNVRVTLAWDDPPATRLAASTLINDLDLRLTDPDGITYQPFILNPASPGNVAGNGNDTINNIEMVIGTAKAGTWTVSVAGTSVPQGPQQYTLVTPEDAAANNQPPEADANGPYVTDEGTNATLNGGGSSDPDGDALTFEWDLNYDGVTFDVDATGSNPNFDTVGDNDVFSIALRVTDPDGAFDLDDTTVTVSNVTPDVEIDSGQVTEIDEGDFLNVRASFSDPGWLDTYTSLIDWGTGESQAGMLVVTVDGPPADQGEVSGSHQYGDNGAFSLTVSVTDDDGGMGVDVFDLTVNNVDPTAEIDESGSVLVNGVATFMAHVGEPVDFYGRSWDPGSDDLFLGWDWDNGPPAPDVVTTYGVNPPDPDPFPSPSVQPRDVTDTKTHIFGEACHYEIRFLANDDDGGNGEDAVNVIIRGNARRARSAGYWQHQYRGNGNIDFDRATLECYLVIVDYVSTVFNVERDVSTIAKAHDVLFLKQNGGSATEQFDRELLTVWLNFANGAFEYEAVADVVATAEAIRLDPNATEADIREQKNILHQLNN